jgi:hypothetical protein
VWFGQPEHNADELAAMYPTEYGFIRDKRGRDWRDIAKIPFIDETALVTAYNAVCAHVCVLLRTFF